jgi:hypothetical protein
MQKKNKAKMIKEESSISNGESSLKESGAGQQP